MILISEILNMPEFGEFRAVTNDVGLNKRFDNIGIHDYESIEMIPKSFRKGDFVLTTLFACKDNPEEVEIYINALIDADVTAIAIKEVFFNSVPESCIRKAKENNTAILFYPRHIYTEDIIIKIKNLLDDDKSYEEFEITIKALLDGTIDSEKEQYFRKRINPEELPYVSVAYLLQKRENQSRLLYDGRSIRDVAAALPGKWSIFLNKYENGLIVFIEHDDHKKCKHTLQLILTAVENISYYWVGYEILESRSSKLDKTITNALNAAKVCKIEDADNLSYEKIGMYKMLLPENENRGIIEQCIKTADKIKAYDMDNNANLFETAEVYIDTDGDVAKTSEILHQHANTVRYRINKLKELLGDEKSYYVELYLTMKVNKIEASKKHR